MQNLNQGKAIDLNLLLSELLMQDSIAAIMSQFELLGMQTVVKSYDGSYFAIEVTKCEMSFG